MSRFIGENSPSIVIFTGLVFGSKQWWFKCLNDVMGHSWLSVRFGEVSNTDSKFSQPLFIVSL